MNTGVRVSNIPASASIDVTPALVVDPYTFARSADWRIIGEPPAAKVDQSSAPPGTWWLPDPNTRVAQFFAKIGMLAMLRCPNCKSVSALHRSVHRIGRAHRLSPDWQCPHCEFHRRVHLDRWGNKPLYACALVWNRAGRLVPDIVYTLASTPAEARAQLGPGNYEITAIGRAVGFVVKDRRGEVMGTSAAAQGPATRVDRDHNPERLVR